MTERLVAAGHPISEVNVEEASASRTTRRQEPLDVKA